MSGRFCFNGTPELGDKLTIKVQTIDIEACSKNEEGVIEAPILGH